MAKLSDLPDELIHIIIELSISVYPPTADIHGKDHNQIRGIEPALRPHLVNKQQNRHYCFDLKKYSKRDPKDSPDLAEVSCPEGVPRNPYLALSLVNRAFRRCAQQILFENISLKDQWAAALFLQGLTQIVPLDQQELDGQIKIYARNDGDAQRNAKAGIGTSSKIYSLCLSEPSQHVRSVQFMWNGISSMGKGGGRLISDIIRSCPLLENIAISPEFYIRCKEPILEALASSAHVTDFVVSSNHPSNQAMFEWRADEVVSRLFSKWESLETIEFVNLSG
ncbi:hypothetical protein PGT21_024166 [Puccinia graminis f. sp. tritici]|uniref:Uncharacterized protein n=1 Tax=Puccinia graminis f. sp. tritici TaxID=56615 RepID=A0A5B0MA83_PUCGR|nr:hypothetical protein PGT21_024166 [Puccinia graminis f. sp. tritici]